MIVVVTVLPRSSINFHTFPRKILNKNKNVSSSAVFQVRQTNLVRLFFRVPLFVLIRLLVSFLYISLYLSIFPSKCLISLPVKILNFYNT